jgi:hypothetical protein
MTRPPGTGQGPALGRLESRGYGLSHGSHVDRTRLSPGQQADEALWPQDVDSPCRKGPTDERPVSLDETQRSGDRYVTHKTTDKFDLLENPIHEFGAVPPADEELLNAGSQDAAFDSKLRLPPYRLASITQIPARVMTM